ncbi:MAG: peptidylprolyl isomerase [Actinomycetota bacterium]|nr:peptidylprolyl isomerase [Actinomycetota bacterium]
MKRLLPIFVLAALVLAACGGASGAVAATVDGTDITVGEIEELTDPGEDIVSKELFAQFLSFKIRWTINEAAAEEDYGVTASEAEILAEADRIYDTVNTGESREEFLSSRGVTEEFLINVAHQGLLDLGVRDEISAGVPAPTPEEVATEMETATAALTQVCVSHILVDTLPEAEDAVGRIDAGEDFGDLATELSNDPGSGANGGVLPCGSAGQYVPEFSEASLVAPINEIYDEIVETTFGFHIILVTDRTEPTEEELPTSQEVIDSLTGNAASQEFNVWLLAQASEAEVTVDEEYGTWQTDGEPQVIPPTG